MFSQTAAEYCKTKYKQHTRETGHANFDSDDDFEIRCRECDWSYYFDWETEFENLERELRFWKFDTYIESHIGRFWMRTKKDEIIYTFSNGPEEGGYFDGYYDASGVYSDDEIDFDKSTESGNIMMVPYTEPNSFVMLDKRLEIKEDEIKTKSHTGKNGEITTYKRWKE